jgi:hypothetical protein
VIDEVLDALVTKTQALALELAGVSVPVTKGKQPLQEDGSGAANTQFTVAADQRPKDFVRFDSLHDLHTVRAQVVVWTPGNRDNAANLPTLSAWEDAVQAALNASPSGLAVAGEVLLDVRATAGVFLDRGSFAVGWDVSATDVEVDVVRLRGAA